MRHWTMLSYAVDKAAAESQFKNWGATDVFWFQNRLVEQGGMPDYFTAMVKVEGRWYIAHKDGRTVGIAMDDNQPGVIAQTGELASLIWMRDVKMRHLDDEREQVRKTEEFIFNLNNEIDQKKGG